MPAPAGIPLGGASRRSSPAGRMRATRHDTTQHDTYIHRHGTAAVGDTMRLGARVGRDCAEQRARGSGSSIIRLSCNADMEARAAEEPRTIITAAQCL